MNTHELKEYAISYLDEGLNVLPCYKKDKCPRYPWSGYQHGMISETKLESLFQQNYDSICLITGKISGNLEVIDFDQQGKAYPMWKEKANQMIKNSRNKQKGISWIERYGIEEANRRRQNLIMKVIGLGREGRNEKTILDNIEIKTSNSNIMF